MNCTKRYFDACNCWEKFIDNCGDNLIKKFAKYLYEHHLSDGMNNNVDSRNLDISVGKDSGNSFASFLSVVANGFMIMLERWNDEPVLVFKDMSRRNGITLCSINLTAMKNFRYNKEEIFDRNGEYCGLNVRIVFNYNNEIDYHINMSVA